MKIVNILTTCALFLIADAFESNDSLPLMGKLINGQKVANDEMKFMASFRHRNIHMCAVSLITYKHGLTAARYLHDFFFVYPIPNFDEYSLVIDCHILSEGTAHSIEQVESSEKYDDDSVASLYGVAVITLRLEIPSAAVSLIKLSTTPEYEIRSTLRADIVGWARLCNKYKLEFSLRTEKVGISTPYICSKSASDPIYCVVSKKTFTREDFGAPLIYNSSLIGLFYHAFSVKKRMAIYIAINKFYHEIYAMTEEHRVPKMLRAPRNVARFDWY